MSYPGNADAIGTWIDDAFDQSGAIHGLRRGARGPREPRQTRRPLREDHALGLLRALLQDVVAGAYYPGANEIKVLNIYYTWSGANRGWLRHAKDLLVWEMANFMGVKSGIQPEPRPEGWPCNAPPLPKP